MIQSIISTILVIFIGSILYFPGIIGLLILRELGSDELIGFMIVFIPIALMIILGVLLTLYKYLGLYIWRFLLHAIILIISFPALNILIVYILNIIQSNKLYTLRDLENNGVMPLIFLGIFIFIVRKMTYYRNKKIELKIQSSGVDHNSTFNNTKTVTIETTELMTSLSQIDISNIASITFLPTDGQGFTIKTLNIKRLTIYITTKLKKNIFEGEELRKAFDHVVHHISSDLSKTDFNLVQGKINEFVKSGGKVVINSK